MIMPTDDQVKARLDGMAEQGTAVFSDLLDHVVERREGKLPALLAHKGTPALLVWVINRMTERAGDELLKESVADFFYWTDSPRTFEDVRGDLVEAQA